MRSTVLMAAMVGLVAAVPAPAASPGFVVRATTVEDAELRQLARQFEGKGTLQTLANHLNAMFVLPREVGIRLLQCDEANAFYDTESEEIQICLEIVDGMAEVLRPQFDDDEEYADALAGGFIATALHEAGHALVDVLELPITGREEDAVDQMSAWLLIRAGEASAVLGAAATYYTDVDNGEQDFSGEHSLDRQRYFNHVCWVYGSAPDEHAFLLEDWELPEARADLCEEEYRLLDRSWTRLLSGHLRTPTGVPSALTVERVPPRPAGIPAIEILDEVTDAPVVAGSSRSADYLRADYLEADEARGSAADDGRGSFADDDRGPLTERDDSPPTARRGPTYPYIGRQANE